MLGAEGGGWPVFDDIDDGSDGGEDDDGCKHAGTSIEMISD
jgi:hypothetical protein